MYIQTCCKQGPHVLADQLTLSQPEGAHYPDLVLCAPSRIFRPFDGPDIIQFLDTSENKE